MKNILVVGTGRFGRYAIEALHSLGHQILAIDRHEERINKVLPMVTGAEIGDSTDMQFMQTLGVEDFDLCIVAIGDDFLSSLETAAVLKDLGAKYIVARATGESQEKLLKRCGADVVVFPERQLGRWTAIRYSADNILDYIELEDGFTILKVDTPAEWGGKTLGEMDVRNRFGINILGIEDHGRMSMSINSETVMVADRDILVLGKTEDLQKVFHF